MTDKPSLLMCKTIIGFGSPNKAGTHDSHGAPLGDAEIALTREQLGWKYAPFEIPSEIYAQWDAKEAGQAKESAWNEKFAAYAKAYPQEAAEFTRRMKGEMPSDFDAKAKEFMLNCRLTRRRSPAVKRLRMLSKRSGRCCRNSSAVLQTWRRLT